MKRPDKEPSLRLALVLSSTAYDRTPICGPAGSNMFATRQLNRILPALCAALLILGTLESGAAAQLQIPSRTTRDLGQPSNQTRQFYASPSVPQAQPSNQTRQFYVPPTTNQAQPRTARSTRPVQPQRFGQRSTPTRSFTPATRAAFPTRRPTQQVTPVSYTHLTLPTIYPV